VTRALALAAVAAIAVGVVVASLTGGDHSGERSAGVRLTGEERVDALVAKLTTAEKLQLVRGVAVCGRPTADAPAADRSLGGAGFIPGVERLGIPDINYTDGPVGVTNCGGRTQGEATVLPSPLARGASWDPKVAAAAGELLGREAHRQGFTGVLGGAVELIRDPRWGRSFEVPGEDPLLNGALVGAEVRAVQAQQVVGTLKHFALNNQETSRMRVSANPDERTLRELHLLPYEIALRASGAMSVMCAYNRVGGTHACENERLLTQILKGEWGFRGQVQSDWGATRSTGRAARAGLDEEQFEGRYYGAALAEAVATERVPAARLDDMVRRKLRALASVGLLDAPPPEPRPVDHARGAAVARRLAARSIVLLRNDGDVLPLRRSLRSLAVIGAHADVGVLSGGGSSQVSPVGGPAVPPRCDVEVPGGSRCPVWVPSSPLAAIRRAAPDTRVRFSAGANMRAAARAAAHADAAVVFAAEWRREGQDRPTLALPGGQDRLIRAVAAANPRTVVVLETGGPVTLPWSNEVPALLEAWYPGSRGGRAIADVLFGAVNPSAKLPVTFPRRDSDTPAGAAPPPGRVDPYRHRLLVGYRFYDAADRRPRFPFGHGLSYTSFDYSRLRVRREGRGLHVSVTVRNRGRRRGAETAQVYVRLPRAAGEPPQRLVAWGRAELDPGEARRLWLTVPPRRLAVWRGGRERWAVPAGRYEVRIGASSRDIRRRTSIALGTPGA
jgi:beta-glucosidase